MTMRETNQVPRRPRRLGRGPAAVCAALLLAWSAGCDIKEALFFMPAPLLTDGGTDTGTLEGRVTSGSQGLAGVTVTIRRGGQTVATRTTDGSGNYQVVGLDPGAVTVSITAPSGFTCEGEKSATIVADETRRADFSCTAVPTTGTVTGMVTSGTTPIPNATVTIGTRTTTTNASGTYTLTNVPAGAQTVTTTATGFTCPNATSTVVAGQSTTTNVSCTQTPVPPGSIDVGVTVNGSPRSGVAVTIRQGTTTVATGSTGTNGRFVAGSLPPGTYDVSISPPAGVTCPSTAANGVAVASNQTTLVNFACTQAAQDFTVNLNQPQPGWEHPTGSPNSFECKVISTSPAQPGASYTVSTTGPGVITQASPGFLDVNGKAEIRVPISSTGTYVNQVTVTSGAVQGSASISVSVTGASNVCPSSASPSSARFKTDVAALLPAGSSLLGLRPVAFRYLAPYGDPAVARVGLIAEEVVRIFPHAVALGPDGRPYGINYGALTGLIISELETRARASLKGGIARLAETFSAP